jgi:hypothetical protein
MLGGVPLTFNQGYPECFPKVFGFPIENHSIFGRMLIDEEIRPVPYKIGPLYYLL